jgi:aspartate dehydrogenase
MPTAERWQMKKKKIGIVGCGAIGKGVAIFIDKQLCAKTRVSALTDMDSRSALNLQKRLSSRPEIMTLEENVKKNDLIIEAASIKGAKSVLEKALFYKKEVVIVSVGAFVGKASIISRAAKKGITVYVPSGAICGVDGFGALRMGKVKKISLVTSKPPSGLTGADYLKKKKIDLTGLKKERIVFKGGVKEAIRCFPKNINIAATLSLASEFKDIEVCIKADPNIKRNIHRIFIDSEQARLNISIENIPSKLNPKTSALTVLSLQFLLNKMFSNFKVGS